MNDSTTETTQLGFQRRYLRLQLRCFLLKLANLALKFRIFRLECTFRILQLRYAVILHVHENYPFLFWF